MLPLRALSFANSFADTDAGVLGVLWQRAHVLGAGLDVLERERDRHQHLRRNAWSGGGTDPRGVARRRQAEVAAVLVAELRGAVVPDAIAFGPLPRTSTGKVQSGLGGQTP
jgi:hypothetical protein